MIVLGFDTATPASAIGLRLSDGHTLQARDDPAPGERPGHATRLLPLAADLLDQAGLSWREIDRIAVGVGPGGFTGLRVGVASARGLAQSLGAELVGVSSPRALAVGALDVEGSGAQAAAGVLAAIDARRGEVFIGAYTRGRTPEAPAVELLSARTVSPQDLQGLGASVDLPRLDKLAAVTHWIAVGNGAVLYRAELERLGIGVPPDGDRVHAVSGAAICRLAAEAHAQPVEAVMPDYLRPPDAEVALERQARAVEGAPA